MVTMDEFQTDINLVSISSEIFKLALNTFILVRKKGNLPQPTYYRFFDLMMMHRRQVLQSQKIKIGFGPIYNSTNSFL